MVEVRKAKGDTLEFHKVPYFTILSVCTPLLIPALDGEVARINLDSKLEQWYTLLFVREDQFGFN